MDVENIHKYDAVLILLLGGMVFCRFARKSAIPRRISRDKLSHVELGQPIKNVAPSLGSKVQISSLLHLLQLCDLLLQSILLALGVLLDGCLGFRNLCLQLCLLVLHDWCFFSSAKAIFGLVRPKIKPMKEAITTAPRGELLLVS